MPENPTVIDLFAGVGGLSLGAARAGFEVLAAVESDPIAIASHKKNFPTSKHLQKDIRKLNGISILKEIDLQEGEVTGIVGGPPCQGFSNMGHRNGRDGRNHLFGHFFRLVNQIRPAFFVAENVPGILHPRYDRMRANAFSKLPDIYTFLEPLIMKASDYGVPTTRTRVFFIGYDRTKFRSELTASDFDPPNDAETVTVAMALKGLPMKISENWKSEKAEWQKVVKTNGNRYMAKIGGNIPKGVGDKAAKQAYKNLSLTSGCQGTRHLAHVVARFSAVKPGKTDEISRAMRLDAAGFCPTLRAGTGSDRGSYQAIRPIHFSQARVITPREAARLQGFPDWFVFHPTKWHSFRQIGNSVSPIVAEHILKVLSKGLVKPKTESE
jgi:DNA (cytosine-5)-methyltransferase 1